MKKTELADCKYRKLEISKGQKFGMLTYLNEAGRTKLPSGQWNRMVSVKCDCGNEKVVRVLHLVRERMKSCGCLVPQHGQSYTKLYIVWKAMHVRCYTDTCIDHHRYKDRGITMCDEWKGNFMSFKSWADVNGYQHGLQIDRIDNNKGYSPENCRFVTMRENANNREVTHRVIYNGQLQSFQTLLSEKGLTMHHSAIYARLKRGWSVSEAIDTPIKQGKYKRKHGILSENN